MLTGVGGGAVRAAAGVVTADLDSIAYGAGMAAGGVVRGSQHMAEGICLGAETAWGGDSPGPWGMRWRARSLPQSAGESGTDNSLATKYRAQDLRGPM